MLGSIWRSIKFLTPSFNRALSKFGYEMAAKNFQFEDWRFMNFGYVYEDDKDSPVLEKTDELDRYFIQLYDHLIKDLNVENKKILEVGSGRGGGANYISKYYKPLSYVGIDISQNAIDFSNRVNNIDTLSFEQGDAENLSFKDQTFDIVINVESSHCYGNMERFLSEVSRVVKPGGYFGWADLRAKDMVEETEFAFEKSNLTCMHNKTITPEVIDALDDIHDVKMKMINNHVPKFLRSAFTDFAGAKNSKIYNSFKSGNAVYLSKVLKK